MNEIINKVIINFTESTRSAWEPPKPTHWVCLSRSHWFDLGMTSRPSPLQHGPLVWLLCGHEGSSCSPPCLPVVGLSLLQSQLAMGRAPETMSPVKLFSPLS